MKKGEVNSKDSAPYYPYQKPHTPQKDEYKQHKNFQHQHDYHDIYQNDQKPYYGPGEAYNKIDTTKSPGIHIKVTMGDLTDKMATDENINELQKQLDNLNRYIAGPKKMLSNEQFAHVYQKDPNAYYDPTGVDLNARKAYLEKTLADLRKQKADNDRLQKELTGVSVNQEKGKITIQNKVNADKEKENSVISNNFYYPLPSGSVPAKEKESNSSSDLIKYVTVSSNQEELKKTNPSSNPTAPSTIPVKESKNDAKLINTLGAKRQENVKEEDRLSKLNTQGLKVNKVKIVKFRKE
jgi:hypothetical protein